jgi:hypothetical protein
LDDKLLLKITGYICLLFFRESSIDPTQDKGMRLDRYPAVRPSWA